MTAATETRRSLPTGTWQLDPVHSSIGFEIEYIVGAFRGQFRDVDATLTASEDGAQLQGAARVASVDVKDENLSAHLQSPDFFDAERHPELTFSSHELERDGNALVARGELTIKGVTQRVELTGTIVDPTTDAYGRERIGLRLETTVDRTAFGVDWNTPLPDGRPSLGNDVVLAAELYFVEA
jgi:polyisoprenoid-binding protein YceI